MCVLVYLHFVGVLLECLVGFLDFAATGRRQLREKFMGGRSKLEWVCRLRVTNWRKTDEHLGSGEKELDRDQYINALECVFG